MGLFLWCSHYPPCMILCVTEEGSYNNILWQLVSQIRAVLHPESYTSGPERIKNYWVNWIVYRKPGLTQTRDTKNGNKISHKYKWIDRNRFLYCTWLLKYHIPRSTRSENVYRPGQWDPLSHIILLIPFELHNSCTKCIVSHALHQGFEATRMCHHNNKYISCSIYSIV